MPADSIKKTVKAKLTDYLEEKGLRKTPERYTILEEIYSHHGHFTIEELHSWLLAKKYMVSRATLYNTMDMLLKSQLVCRHNFQSRGTHYERTYLVAPHEHIICGDCGKIQEIPGDGLNDLIEKIGIQYDFSPESHILYIYGTCAACRLKRGNIDR